MKLSERLLQLRREREVSQIELAETLNVSRQAVSRWETGQSTPSAEKLQFLAEFYGVTLDELFCSVEKKQNPQEQNPTPQTAEEKRKRKWIYLCAAAVVIVLVVAVLIAAIGHNEEVKEPVSIDDIQGIVIDPDEIMEEEFELIE